MTYSNRWNQFIYRLWAPVYDWLIPFHPATRARAGAFAHAEMDLAKRVLLVGVGTGADLPYVSGVPGLVGVDLSGPMLRRTRSKAERLHLPLVVIAADAGDLPFADASFDVVAMTLFVSVVPDPEACIQQAGRVLRDGGRIVVLDKFLPEGRPPSILRRILNAVTRPLGTDINRRWTDIAPDSFAVLFDETTGPFDSIRTIVLQKRDAALARS